MSYRRRPSVWFAVAVVLLYGFRAFNGWMDGWAYPAGRRLAVQGQQKLALPLLERGALGAKRSAALWLAGQIRTDLWHQGTLADEPSDRLDKLRTDAFRDLTAALAANPAGGWYWLSLADLYHRQEQVERFRRGRTLDLLSHGRWSFVGRPGRIAIGMARIGIEREPTWFLFQDQLAMMLLDNDLYEAASEAVRRSAATLPFYQWHAFEDLDPPPDRILDAFAEGARAALGNTPLFDPVVHRAALGRLEFRRGRWAQAVDDFRAVLDSPSPNVNQAFVQLYLGRALTHLGRYGGAENALTEAQNHPETETAALIARAVLAEETDNLEKALDLLRRARRSEPQRLGLVLRFARVAQRLEDWAKAEEALRWALTLSPGRTDTVRQLVEVNVAQGDFSRARALLDDLRRLPGTEEEVRILERRLSPGVQR